MPVILEDVRLTFVWAEVLVPAIEQQIAADSPFYFLTRGYLYRDKFDQARSGQAVNPKLEPPWIPGRRQQFWMRYLRQQYLSQSTGNQAFDWLVPHRHSPGIQISANWFPGRSGVEVFFYPFGIAVAISFHWAPKLALEAFIPRAFEFRKTGEFTLTGASRPVRLEEAAGLILDSVREKAAGKGALAGPRSPEPFSVLTVTQASGASASATLEQSPAVRRSLEAVANWRQDWKDVTLPQLTEVCLPTKGTAPAGSALYAQERGRVVWFPALFSSEPSHTLACYHRNLSLASTQVEAMAQLVRHGAEVFAQGKQAVDLTSHHRAVLKIAVEQLTKLKRGDKGETWRSASVERQIRDTCEKELQIVAAKLA